jgi:hypothetical protein
MEAAMARRLKIAGRLVLEVGFEPRHGSHEALGQAYECLLPPRSRPVRTPAGLRARLKEAYDGAANDAPNADATDGTSPGGDLRPRLIGTAG